MENRRSLLTKVAQRVRSLKFKRISALLCMALLLNNVAAAPSQYQVTNKTEFLNAMSAIAEQPAGSTAYVFIRGDIKVGILYNTESGCMTNILQNIHFVGIDNEETGNQATLRMEMFLPVVTSKSSGFSLHFENLKLCQTQGVWGNAKHLVHFNDEYVHYIDSLEFIGCDLTEICRSIFRADASRNDTPAGGLKYFRMENCRVHNGFRQSNAMPAFYFSMPVDQMIFRNNTFYDLPYMNGIVTFDKLTDYTGRKPVLFRFENNTVCAWSKKALFDFGTNVGNESEFHIKNNMLLMPTWANAMNNRFGDTKDNQGQDEEGTCGCLTSGEISARIAEGAAVTNISGGAVQLECNMLHGYKYQDMSEAINNYMVYPIGDDTNKEVNFSSMTMADVGFGWTDFADAQNGDFHIGKEHAVYTAGKNGAPLGNKNEYEQDAEVETYGLKVCNKDVTSKNCTDILGDGTFSYSPKQKVLNVKGSYGDTSMETLLIDNESVQDLTISVDADATLSSMAVLQAHQNTTITGSGYLTIAGDWVGLSAGQDVTLTLKDISMTVEANYYAVIGAEALDAGTGTSLVLDNVSLKARVNYASETLAVGGFDNITLKDCSIVLPENGKVANGSIVDANGTPATEVEIGTETKTTSKYEVTKKAEFKNALSAIAELPAGSTAYVFIKGDINAGTLSNTGSGYMANIQQNIHFVGVDDEETGSQATLRMEMELPVVTSKDSGFSLHFENLKLCQTQGVWGNAKHLVHFNDEYVHYIDSLEFIGCDLTEICRSIFRADASRNDTPAGGLKYFRMENCRVHNGFRQSNAMPAFYFSMPVDQMIFRNNTFYDLPYMNGIVTFDKLTDYTGRKPVLFRFENNTVCAWSKKALFDFGTNVGYDSEFHIKNNMLLMPTWANTMNNRYGDTYENQGQDEEGVCGCLTSGEISARIAEGAVVTNISGGAVQLECNMLLGYKYQDMSEAINNYMVYPIGDDTNKEVNFSSMTMADVGFDWTDFADAQNGDFHIGKNHAVYTAGKNGAPLGNKNEYEDIETYGLRVCNKNVTSYNCTDILGDGTFSYNPKQKVLNVKGSYGDTSMETLLIDNESVQDLTISVDADATLSSMAVLQAQQNTTITGSGYLTVVGEMIGLYVSEGATLTLKDISMTAEAEYYAVIGAEAIEAGTDASLVLDNVSLKARAKSDSEGLAIGGFSSITLNDCNIVLPENGWVYNGNIVDMYGVPALEVETVGLIDGISAAKASPETNNHYYTLDGRRTAGQPTKKGIYIKNGRKIAIK